MAQQTIPRPTKVDPKVIECLSALLQIQMITKLTHLRQYSLSGWEHKALDKLYNGLGDLLDTLIESYQGTYGLLDLEVKPSVAEQNAISFVQGSYDYVEKSRYLFKESWLQNQLDEIQTLFSQTLFRLKYTK